MDNISVHGESAIGAANMGRRQADTHVRVGVLLWFVLTAISTVFATTRLGGFSIGLMVFLQIASLLAAVAVTKMLGRMNRRKREAEDAAFRQTRAAEKARQLADFVKERDE
ncbi:MAG: hypothetical protein AB8B62_12420 [Roseobacter sp.]